MDTGMETIQSVLESLPKVERWTWNYMNQQHSTKDMAKCIQARTLWGVSDGSVKEVNTTSGWILKGAQHDLILGGISYQEIEQTQHAENSLVLLNVYKIVYS